MEGSDRADPRVGGDGRGRGCAGGSQGFGQHLEYSGRGLRTVEKFNWTLGL